MTATADEQKIIQRARQWDETRKAKGKKGATPREQARLDRAHWKAGNDLSEAIEKARAPP